MGIGNVGGEVSETSSINAIYKEKQQKISSL